MVHSKTHDQHWIRKRKEKYVGIHKNRCCFGMLLRLPRVEAMVCSVIHNNNAIYCFAKSHLVTVVLFVFIARVASQLPTCFGMVPYRRHNTFAAKFLSSSPYYESTFLLLFPVLYSRLDSRSFPLSLQVRYW